MPTCQKQTICYNSDIIHYYYKNKAFTLAEVLITLGIIGIVAALTLPSVITKYQKKQTVAQLKVVYSILNQAVARSIVDNGELEYWDWVNVEAGSPRFTVFAEKYILPYINGVQKNSDYTMLWKRLDGIYDNSGSYSRTWVEYKLANGTLLSFDGIYYPAEDSGNRVKTSLAVFVDLNGYKKPNRAGRDVFVFTLFPYTSNNFVAGYYEYCGSGARHFNLTREQLLQDGYCAACNKNYSGMGYGCAALIQKDGWEIKDDYPW